MHDLYLVDPNFQRAKIIAAYMHYEKWIMLGFYVGKYSRKIFFVKHPRGWLIDGAENAN